MSQTKRKTVIAVVLVALAICLGTASVIARSSQLRAPRLEPKEILRIPWGTTDDTVAYRTVQAGGWQGPSTIAVDRGMVYIVDRINREIKIYGSKGQLCSYIALPEQYSRHPHQLEIVGESLYLTYRDAAQPMNLAIYRGGQWKDIDLTKDLSGFSGWLELSSGGSGRLSIRRDIPPEDDKGDIARWAVLDEAGALLSSAMSVNASPDADGLQPHLVTAGTDREPTSPANQEIALVDHAGVVVKRAAIENGAVTNVITMLRDKNQSVFMHTRTYTGELDRWTTYLTVFGPNLEQRARVALVLPERYRGSFVWPASDVGHTDVVADDKYYELLYQKDGIVVLEWDPFTK